DNPRDGRQVVVRITPKGRLQMDNYVRERELWLTEQLSEFEPEEQEVVRNAAALLDRLAAQ
ncbi:MAG TPA: MarR family transcriptional regulator, partial [Mycobacterium sp.]